MALEELGVNCQEWLVRKPEQPPQATPTESVATPPEPDATKAPVTKKESQPTTPTADSNKSAACSADKDKESSSSSSSKDVAQDKMVSSNVMY